MKTAYRRQTVLCTTVLYKVSRTDIQEYLATGVTPPDLRDWPTGLGAPTLAAPGNGVDDDGDGEIDEPGEQDICAGPAAG